MSKLVAPTVFTEPFDVCDISIFIWKHIIYRASGKF